MLRLKFEQVSKSMKNYQFILIITVLVVVAAAILGGFTAINIKYSLLALGLLLLIVFLRYFDIYIFIYLLALTWWMPLEVGRFLPLQNYLGLWSQHITIPEILAYMGLAASLIRSRKFAERIFSEPVWIFLALLTVGGILAAGAIKTDAGIVMFRRSTFFFTAVILLCRGLLADRKIIKRVMGMVMLSGVLFGGYILFAQFVEKSFFVGPGAYEGASRLGGYYQIPFMGTFYFGPNNVGLLTAILASISFALILLSSSRRNRILMSGVFLFNVIILVLTGSRASIASLLIGVVCLVFYMLFLRKRGRVVVYVLVFSAAVAILVPLVAPPQILQRLQYIVAIGNDPYGSIQTRMGLLEEGLQLLVKNPFGIGYGTFITLHSNSTFWEQNLFLNTALGAGILGLLSLVGFYVLLFLRAGRRLITARDTSFLYIMAGSITFFVNSLFTDPNSETSVYFCWLILGISFAAFSIQSQTSEADQVTEPSRTEPGIQFHGQ